MATKETLAFYVNSQAAMLSLAQEQMQAMNRAVVLDSATRHQHLVALIDSLTLPPLPALPPLRRDRTVVQLLDTFTYTLRGHLDAVEENTQAAFNNMLRAFDALRQAQRPAAGAAPAAGAPPHAPQPGGHGGVHIEEVVDEDPAPPPQGPPPPNGANVQLQDQGPDIEVVEDEDDPSEADSAEPVPDGQEVIILQQEEPVDGGALNPAPAPGDVPLNLDDILDNVLHDLPPPGQGDLQPGPGPDNAQLLEDAPPAPQLNPVPEPDAVEDAAEPAQPQDDAQDPDNALLPQPQGHAQGLDEAELPQPQGHPQDLDDAPPAPQDALVPEPDAAQPQDDAQDLNEAELPQPQNPGQDPDDVGLLHPLDDAPPAQPRNAPPPPLDPAVQSDDESESGSEQFEDARSHLSEVSEESFHTAFSNPDADAHSVASDDSMPSLEDASSIGDHDDEEAAPYIPPSFVRDPRERQDLQQNGPLAHWTWKWDPAIITRINLSENTEERFLKGAKASREALYRRGLSDVERVQKAIRKWKDQQKEEHFLGPYKIMNRVKRALDQLAKARQNRLLSLAQRPK